MITAKRILREIEDLLGEFSDSEDYDLISEYWQNRLYNKLQALKKELEREQK